MNSRQLYLNWDEVRTIETLLKQMRKIVPGPLSGVLDMPAHGTIAWNPLGIAISYDSPETGIPDGAAEQLDNVIAAGTSEWGLAAPAPDAPVELEAQREALVTALEMLKHADGCYCEAAFAGPGTIVGHTHECEAAREALARAKGDA